MQGLLLWGNGYAEIEWNDAGQVTAFGSLRPDRMGVERRGAVLVYTYWLEIGGRVELPAWRVLHIRGLTGDGLVGYSVIRELMRESLGLGLATQELGAHFFGNGARPALHRPHQHAEAFHVQDAPPWPAVCQQIGRTVNATGSSGWCGRRISRL